MDFESLHEFCLKYWLSKELQEDDISAIIINNERTTPLKIIHPPNDFSFPKVKEEEFKPTPVTQRTSTKFTDMQMQEIRNQFNGVANDFFEVRKKLKLLIVLLISTVSLLVICLLFIFWFRPNKDHQELQTNKKTSENTSIKTLEERNKNLELKIKYLNKQLANQTSTIQEPTMPQKKEE
jgi:multidrug efflux pump subunit AcrB